MFYTLAEGTVSRTMTDVISEIFDFVPKAVESVANTIIGNPLLTIFVGISLFGMGIALFRGLKNA